MPVGRGQSTGRHLCQYHFLSNGLSNEPELKHGGSRLLIFALLEGRETQWLLGSDSEYSPFILQPPATPRLFRTFWVQDPGHGAPAPAVGWTGPVPPYSALLAATIISQITLYTFMQTCLHLSASL